jgi:hypothetical protein
MVEGPGFDYLALSILVLCYAVSRYVVRSQFGLVLAGMRQNEERLAFFGYRIQVFKALISPSRVCWRDLRALRPYHQGFIGPGNMGPGLSTTAVLDARSAAPARRIGPGHLACPAHRDDQLCAGRSGWRSSSTRPSSSASRRWWSSAFKPGYGDPRILRVFPRTHRVLPRRAAASSSLEGPGRHQALRNPAGLGGLDVARPPGPSTG